MIDPAYRHRLSRENPAYLARLEEADRLRDDFALAFGVRECRWSDHNLSRLLNATGERPERVKEMRAIIGRLESRVFDHDEMWARGRVPMILVGHPYQIEPEHRAALAYLARTFPTIRVSVDDRPSYYGFGTHHVRVELVTVARPFLLRNPPATYRTRQAASAARKAFTEEMTP
jgi:hypothetical protein